MIIFLVQMLFPCLGLIWPLKYVSIDMNWGLPKKFRNDRVFRHQFLAPPLPVSSCHHSSSFGRSPPSPSSDDVIYEQPLIHTKCQTSSNICVSTLYTVYSLRTLFPPQKGISIQFYVNLCHKAFTNLQQFFWTWFWPPTRPPAHPTPPWKMEKCLKKSAEELIGG